MIMSRKIDNILLIDDDEPTNFLTNLMIQESGIGCDVHTMYTALDALEWLKVESNPTPDLILLDINMPMMNGWEFLEEYRQLPITTKSKMIIVMLTSSLNPPSSCEYPLTLLRSE